MVGRAGTPGQGPFMLISVKVHDGRIHEANFSTYGCPAAVACGEFTTGWVLGKTLAEAAALQVEDITRGVGGMPLAREHCPGLAVEAVRDAVGDRG